MTFCRVEPFSTFKFFMNDQSIVLSDKRREYRDGFYEVHVRYPHQPLGHRIPDDDSSMFDESGSRDREIRERRRVTHAHLVKSIPVPTMLVAKIGHS